MIVEAGEVSLKPVRQAAGKGELETPHDPKVEFLPLSGKSSLVLKLPAHLESNQTYSNHAGQYPFLKSKCPLNP